MWRTLPISKLNRQSNASPPQDETDAVNPGTKEAVVAELQQATQAVEQAVEQAEIAPPAPQSGTDADKPPAGEHSVREDLSQATQRAEEAVQGVVRDKTEK